MKIPLAFGEKRRSGKHNFRHNLRPTIIVLILMLHVILPVKLAVASDCLGFVGKWTGTREVTVVGRGIVNQKMDAPVALEIANVSQDCSTFRGTLSLYPFGRSSQDRVIDLNGRIENGILKADLGRGARLELSLRGDKLEGSIIRGEFDADRVNLKKIVDSYSK